MIDFSSALYLGIRHPSWSLRPWQALSAGKPAALAGPENACETAQSLAALIGCEQGVLLPSTLHAFWDLFGSLPERVGAIYMDTGAYPVIRWGIERAAYRGLRVRRFQHYNAEALRDHLEQDAQRGLKPAVVVDGFCPACGRSAPIKAYQQCILPHGGYLIIDDTQALGILGRRNEPNIPYGRGGGGTLQWSGIQANNVITVSSLAKGFGVPVAVLTGSHDIVRWFKTKSKTRVHCSPPSVAVIRAAEHALAVNEKFGDDIRQRLAQHVRYFRSAVKEVGLSATGGLFPVQTLVPVPWLDVPTLHHHLLSLGVRTVLHQARNGQSPHLSFSITALHSVVDINCAADALDLAVHKAKGKPLKPEVRYEIRTQ
jgi:8-amino-7-oxononanoate synthase